MESTGLMAMGSLALRVLQVPSIVFVEAFSGSFYCLKLFSNLVNRQEKKLKAKSNAVTYASDPRTFGFL